MVVLRTWRSATLAVVTAFAFMLWLALPAMAHHKSAHAGGPPASAGSGSTGTEVSEDNDNDGVANAPDPVGDSDNMHPSGKDKHAEAGGSGNQGKTRSEPDGNGKGPERDAGGVDQPDGPGGVDTLDQDGNNGCGNDDDFEDDNEGLCLGPQGAPGQTDDADDSTDEADDTTEDTGGTVVDEVAPADVSDAVVEPVVVEPAVFEGVLGEVIRNTPAVAGVPVVAGSGAELAFTGLDALMLIFVAIALAVAGWVSLRAGRRAGARG